MRKCFVRGVGYLVRRRVGRVRLGVIRERRGVRRWRCHRVWGLGGRPLYLGLRAEVQRGEVEIDARLSRQLGG